MSVLVLFLLPLWGVLLVDSGLKLFLLGVRLWRRPEKEEKSAALLVPPHFLSFALIIPVHNEEEVIGETVRELQQLHYPAERYAVVVIADGCTDNTVQSAREHGAWCVVRKKQTGRKGRALAWFLTTERERLNAFDVLIVCDADTRLHPEALLFFNTAFLRGVQVGQGKVESDPRSASPLGALVALSEALSQEVDDQARATLGWPVPLRGTGMAFRRQILQQFGSLPHTRAEDMELSLLLALNQVSVTCVPEAIVYDPKPADVTAATRQRARWFQGHREVVQHYWRDILKVLRSGSLGERALLCSLLLRPRTLVIGVKAFSLLGCLLLPTALPPWVALLVCAGASVTFLADFFYYLIGPAFLTDSGRVRALWRLTLYLPIWVTAMVLSLVSTKGWLSVRNRVVGR